MLTQTLNQGTVVATFGSWTACCVFRLKALRYSLEGDRG